MSLQGQSQNPFQPSHSDTALKDQYGENEKRQVSSSISQDGKPLSISATAPRDASAETIDQIKSCTLHSENTETQETSKHNFTMPTTTEPLEMSDPQQLIQDTHPDGLRSAEVLTQDYLDPTPKTPRQEASPSRTPQDVTKGMGDGNPASEIQSIMEQFGK